ncbi:tetratricopeptide repeat protein 38 isoform X1 [Patella vulgata]|uniref:tetratricopeptide repeat protein 38 isoform X1 n=1 Tax=Patella vulgata TaxID=6465 RepID=UPI0021805160|nr:tetratricopeptide repeat protein 38 isoform X1 [Patella vulgata]XP_050392411.1 tetratricopeptide repeat protein 38 isoform X1 [Patella vulgata]XP_050392418.1 tetratricopeptide repeat protein 38 isoform X1 [Patella vulgata]XP_050392428.1 tetratricopeptide repeat protein 38 isoform X1 [Patella vulgata]
MHCNWRDCQQWRDEKLPLTTTSDEAAKMFDAVVTQYVGWYDDVSVGGIDEAVNKMITADPQFVMGNVVKNGLDLLGTGKTVNLDPEFKLDIEKLNKLCEARNITNREKQHVEAIKQFANGRTDNAYNAWESIISEHPHDMLALKFAHDTYFYLGLKTDMRDSTGRVIKKWNDNIPLYGYLLGMHSFGLEETDLFDEAEKTAKKSLFMNKHDAWATHTMCHVMEMTGRQDDGIQFLDKTVNDWTICNMLACHNFWHWCLYYIEKGDYEEALTIFDNEINRRAQKSGAMLDIVDAASLLYRLKLEGVDIGDRWNDVYELCRPHCEDHILAFNDIHILMACLGANQKQATDQLMSSLRDYCKGESSKNQTISKLYGEPICQAMILYDEGRVEEAVDILQPLRHQIQYIGGSNAQRDVFNLFLIQAALKSSKKEHHALAKIMLQEKQKVKQTAPMADRLMARLLALHTD